MAKYIPFTIDEINRARDTDLVSFLHCRGEKLRRSGSEHEWVGHHITVRGNKWFDQYGQEGGTAIDFAMKTYKLPFADAVRMLLGQGADSESVAYSRAKEGIPEGKPPFALPGKNGNMRRVYAYLTKRRGIASDVVSFFAKENLVYEDAKHHNAVFVGYDGKGVPRHAHKRSTSMQDSSFRGNVQSSDSRYSFHYIGQSDRIYAFEAPIDMLSFITMNPDGWERHSYVSLCSVSPKALFYQLSENPHLKSPVLCLDKDDAGMAAAASIATKLESEGYENAEVLLPQSKDWNEDLVGMENIGADKEERPWAMSQS